MADIFDVIADGTRRDILRLLLDRDYDPHVSGTSVSQIVNELGVSQPTISKHLKVLREAELVTVREEGQHRYYSLSPEPLDTIDDWLVPFLTSEAYDAEPAVALPEPAAAVAERMGRAAASAKHAVTSVFGKRPPR